MKRSHRKPVAPAREAREDRALLALALAALALVTAARALAPLVPGTWLWGVNLQRFLPAWTWLLWAAAVAALVPAIARRGAAPLSAAGDALARGGAWTALAAVGAAAMVFALPDQVRYVGDFLLRQGTIEERFVPARLFPQALPLDVWLHHTLPVWASQRLFFEANLSNRLLGALDAAALAALAVAFGRRLGSRGVEMVAVCAVLVWGGWLALFTGYSKAFCELAVAVLAVGVLGLETLRTGRRAWALAATVAAALLLHRSALALLAAAMFALWSGVRRAIAAREASPRAAPARETPARDAAPGPAPARPSLAAAAAAAGLPLVVAGALLPRVLQTMRAFDAAHFSARDPVAATGAGSLVSPVRLADEANLLLALVPLLPLGLATLVRRPAARVLEPGERAFLLLLAVPFAAVVFVLRPAQGLFRDHDDFATAGMALGLLLAVRVARTLRSLPRAAWLGVAVAAGAAAPGVQWLIHHTDYARGMARIEAFALGPPQRTETERATTWDFLGTRAYRRGDMAAATRFNGLAAALAPSPRIVTAWAISASRAGDWAATARAYRLLLERTPPGKDFDGFRVNAHTGLAAAAVNQDALAEGLRHAEDALRLDPKQPMALRVRDYVRQEQARRARGETTHVTIAAEPPTGVQ